MAKRLEGKAVAEALTEAMKQRVEKLNHNQIYPVLAIIRVGEKPEDLSYEKGAVKRAEKVGVAVRKYLFDESVTQKELLRCIEEINHDEYIHGVLIFRPLPAHICDETIRNALDCGKDVDGITNDSMSSIYCGSEGGFAPCTAAACMEVLRFYGIDPTGKNVVVVGRSLVIGKPIASLLLKANATVTQCHTKTINTAEFCRNADILIVAAGSAGMITEEYCNSGQVILDVGVNIQNNGKMAGDVLYEVVEPVVSAITPVPGGIGAVTSSILMKNVLEAAQNSASKKRKNIFKLY